MIDLHTHHERCGHASGTLEEAARAAAAAGVRIFGWSDHAPLFADAADHPRPGIQMAKSHWDGYLSEARAVRAKLRTDLPTLDLRIGVEADFIPGTEEIYRRALARPELDYVLGSVHQVGEWHIYIPDTWGTLEDPDDFHLGYSQNLRAAAQSGLFDVLSHLDAIRAKVAPARADMSGEIEATLDCIADCGVAVEINGSGVRRTGEFFPSLDILAGLVRRGVPITFGSDAHRAEQIGMGYEAAVAALAELGRERFVTFRGRERLWCTFEGEMLAAQ
jgi:histidinol-phosphatase (PHP family)